MRVTIIDLAERGPTSDLFKRKMSPSFASIMPQAVAVWCEELGHEVRYLCYTGFEDVAGMADDTDMLIVGAFIEARSAERFALLAPELDAELGAFYGGLLAAEARHCDAYVALARAHSDVPIDARVQAFAAAEAELVTQTDERFGFHSGAPHRA